MSRLLFQRNSLTEKRGDPIASRRSSFPTRYALLFLALILVLAAGLRFYRIDAQSFWNDEGNSARLAERSVKLVLEGARGDIHPPGYYLILHYWRALLGQSEAALRGLSAVCSVALVGFTFLLGQSLFRDRAVGLVAAALVAVNPFQVYYAQEARMYAMLALWATVSTWALVAWQRRTGRRWAWAVFVLAAAAGLYTHYAFPFVLLAQNLGVGLWLFVGRRRKGTGRLLLTWLAAQGAVLALYLPWLPTAWHQVTSWSAPGASYALGAALADIWRLLNFGPTVPTEVVVGGLVAAGALLFVSLLPPVDEAVDTTDKIEAETIDDFPYVLRWGLAALLVSVPVALILGLGLYRPAYQKFLLVAAAPASLLLARGAVGGWRIAGGIGVWGEQEAVIGYRAVMLFIGAMLLFDTARSLGNLYFDQRYARADYRAIARRIEADARPGDAVLLNAPNQWEVFTYYYPDDARVYPLARQRPFDAAANRAELEEIVGQHRRLFVIYWGDAESDPGRFIESWLETHTYKAGETWYSDVRLAVYAVPSETADVPQVPLDVHFVPPGNPTGSVIYLDGYTLVTGEVAAGEILQLALFWRTVEAIPERYKVFVHLYDRDGQLVAQTDSEPGATLRPTNTWTPGEQVVDRYGVLIPPGTAAGDHVLVVGLYPVADPDSRLRVVRDGAPGDDRLELTKVSVMSAR